MGTLQAIIFGALLAYTPSLLLLAWILWADRYPNDDNNGREP